MLSFLDVLIDNSYNKLKTSIFRKRTFSGVLTSYLSFTSMSYKLGLVKCLIDRAYKINNTWIGFDFDLKNIFTILKKNSYPEHFINKVTRSYLNKKHNLATDNNKCDNGKQRYFKLPYIGKHSIFTRVKLSKLVTRYCKPDVDIRLIFQSFKIGSCFNVKDSIPCSLKSNVVYKFNCASCNTSYIGQTTRHFATRVKEHLKSDKSSHVYKHLSNNLECKNSCNESSFSIIDYAPTKYQLNVKEGLYIGWQQPLLNKQVWHLSCTLSI